MVSPQLIATLDKLSPDLQAEILNYAEYLATKYTQPPETPPKQYRQAGTMKGMFTMADDLDAPLEDLKANNSLPHSTTLGVIQIRTHSIKSEEIAHLRISLQQSKAGNLKPISELWRVSIQNHPF